MLLSLLFLFCFVAVNVTVIVTSKYYRDQRSPEVYTIKKQTKKGSKVTAAPTTTINQTIILTINLMMIRDDDDDVDGVTERQF